MIIEKFRKLIKLALITYAVAGLIYGVNTPKAYAATQGVDSSGKTTFTFQNCEEFFVSGIHRLKLEVWGGRGAMYGGGELPYAQKVVGYAYGEISVNNEKLYVNVNVGGGAGGKGVGYTGFSGYGYRATNGGYGGGGTDIRRNGNALENRILVAGGSGGRGGTIYYGNSQNPYASLVSTGKSGIQVLEQPYSNANDWYDYRSGGVGTQAAGGYGSLYSGDPYSNSTFAEDGKLGQGGQGVCGRIDFYRNIFNLGGGGGGGGGYYSGGGGGTGGGGVSGQNNVCGGGGSGSSYVGAVENGGKTISETDYSKAVISVTNDAPSVNIVSPMQGEAVPMNNAIINPSLTVSDINNDKLTCSYYIDNATMPTEIVQAQVDSILRSLSFSQYNTNSLSEGFHTIKFIVSDGYTTVEKTTSILVDRTEPYVEADAAGTHDSISINSYADDSISGLDTNAYRYTVGDMVSEWQSSSEFIKNSLLPNKSYVIKVEVRDVAGNVAEISKNIKTQAMVPSFEANNISASSLNFDVKDLNPFGTKYQIKVGTGYLGQDGKIASIPVWILPITGKFEVIGLIPGRLYSLFARAMNSEGAVTLNSGPVKVATQSGDTSLQVKKNVSKYTVKYLDDGLVDIRLRANIRGSAANLNFNVTYNPEELELVDACSMTPEIELETGNIPGTDICIIQNTIGSLTFVLNKNISSNMIIDALINTIKFKQKTQNPVSITYTIE